MGIWGIYFYICNFILIIVLRKKLRNNLPAGKAVRVSIKTYNELAKRGTLTDSFDSVISKLLKKVSQSDSQVGSWDQIATLDNEP
jgi:hypothetical protein